MIPAAPSGWTLSFSGELVVYRDPNGVRIQCFQALPLARASALARAVADGEVRTIERTVTAEGEYAAACTLADGRAFAVVFGDHAAIALLGTARDAAIVRELAMSWRLSRGTRPRRIVYEPPAGWSAMTNDLTTSWFAPGFPAEHAVLVVYPAAPLGEVPDDEVAQLFALEGSGGDASSRPFSTRHGLTGTVTSAQRGHIHRELVVLKRAPYRYAAKLETRSPTAHLGVLAAVVDSFEPLPGTAAHLPALAHWSE